MLRDKKKQKRVKNAAGNPVSGCPWNGNAARGVLCFHVDAGAARHGEACGHGLDSCTFRATTDRGPLENVFDNKLGSGEGENCE
jgi:hypothetical protein